MTTTEAEPATRSRDHVQSLARGLAVLETFSVEQPRLSVSEVAERVGLTRATARRLLLTLQRSGYLRVDGTRFEPAPRLLDLARVYMETHGVWEAVGPIVQELEEVTQESCSVAVLDGWEVVYVVRIPTRRIMSVNLGVGARLPAFATSSGRVMLAALSPQRLDEYLAQVDRVAFTAETTTDPDRLRVILDEVRQVGWALLDQELEIGVRALAVPLRDRRGETVAALAVSAHAGRVTSEALVETFLPQLTATATAVELELARV